MDRRLVVRELVRERPNLFAFVLSLVRDFSAAEEVTARAAASLWRRAGEAPAGAEFGAWARKLARELLDPRLIALGPDAVEAVERATRAEPEGFRKGLEGLGRRPRSLLRMRYREGMRTETIARRVKTTLAKLHAALGRARASLAEGVRGRFDELVWLYLDEALDPEGQEELDRHLVAEGNGAARFVRLSRLHGGLREAEGARGVAEPRRRGPGLLVAAALLVLLALALAGWLLFR